MIAAVCAEKTWVYPAHDKPLGNFLGKEVTPELGATGLAAELAETYSMLAEKLSPATRELIRREVRARVLDPFERSVTGKDKPLRWLPYKMNWNAVCVGNTVFAALTLIESPQERALFVAAGEHYIKNYLAGFTPDGYCGEGIGYWNYGFGHYILLTESVRRATGGQLDLFQDKAAMAPSLFGIRCEILPGICPNIADCTPGSKGRPAFNGYSCRRFGLEAPKTEEFSVKDELWATMLFASLPAKLPVVRQLDPSGESPLRSFFPEGGLLISRSAKGTLPFAAALKGGNNNESHNHNDVGSFSLVIGEEMVVCDPGGEVYTARTFGPKRYESKVLSSYGHAVPVVAGKLQRPGGEARGKILETKFTDDSDLLKLDIRSAYPVPDLEKLERTFVFSRQPEQSLVVRDEVSFSKPESFESALITWGKIKIIDGATVEITDGASTVRVVADAEGKSFEFKQETIDEDVHTKTKPVRLGIALKEKLGSGVITLHLTPVTK